MEFKAFKYASDTVGFIPKLTDKERRILSAASDILAAAEKEISSFDVDYDKTYNPDDIFVIPSKTIKLFLHYEKNNQSMFYMKEG